MATTLLPISGGKAVPIVFGDGSDGSLIASVDTVWNAENEDTGMIVKQFTALTIPEGCTVSAGNRNCGMIIRVRGDCTIAGTLANRMSPKTLLESDNVDFSGWPLSMLTGAAGDGGKGGDDKSLSTTINWSYGGAGMSGRFYGGGWSGGGAGGHGGYEGNYGGNGGAVNTVTTVTDSNLLFIGGAAMLQAGPGNAGQNGGGGSSGAGGTGYNGAGGGRGVNGVANGGGGGNYGGGVIILLVGGNLNVTGTVDCNGGNGGNGNKYGAGAGSGGGGRIFVCHKGTLSNTGTLNVSPGTAGVKGASATLADADGVSGTDGTTAIKTWAQYKEEDLA